MRTTPRATPPRSRTRATVLNPPRSRVPVRGSWTSLRTRRRWRRRPALAAAEVAAAAREKLARVRRDAARNPRAHRATRAVGTRGDATGRAQASRARRARQGDAEMSVTGAGKIRVSRVARLEENEAGKCPGVDDACPSLERIVDEFDRFARCFILGSPSAAVRAAAAATARAAWRSASAGSNARRRVAAALFDELLSAAARGERAAEAFELARWMLRSSGDGVDDAVAEMVATTRAGAAAEALTRTIRAAAAHPNARKRTPPRERPRTTTGSTSRPRRDRAPRTTPTRRRARERKVARDETSAWGRTRGRIRTTRGIVAPSWTRRGGRFGTRIAHSRRD